MILDTKNEVQDALVEQLAIRIANGSVPALSGKRILKLEAPTLFSHSVSDNDAAAKLNAVIDNAIASNGADILFIDKFAGILPSDALKMKFAAAASTGQLTVIAGNNFEEYKQIERDPLVGKLFELIKFGAAPTAPAGVSEDNAAANGFRGQRIAPDLKQMIAGDPRAAAATLVEKLRFEARVL